MATHEEKQREWQLNQAKRTKANSEKINSSMGPTLDESLMRMKGASSGQSASDPGSWQSLLHQQKHINRYPENEDAGDDDADDLDELNDPSDISANLRALKKANKKQNKDLVHGRLQGAGDTSAAILKATNKLLTAAWKNLVSSWGSTLIWINIHVFLRFVLGPNVFCKLGHEWLDTAGAGGAAASGGAAKAVSGAGAGGGGAEGAAVNNCCLAKSCIPWAEITVLIILDLILIILIIAVIVLIVLIVDIVTNLFSFVLKSLFT